MTGLPFRLIYSGAPDCAPAGPPRSEAGEGHTEPAGFRLTEPMLVRPAATKP